MDQREYDFLRRQWFPIARAEDVPDGCARGARILDTALVVYRSSGRLTVAQGHCPHRGVSLAMGALVDGDLECPYHGWRFGGDGRCTAIPSLPLGSSLAGAALAVYPAVERYGHIWSVLGEPTAPLLAIPELDDGARDWQLRCGVPHDLPCGLRQLTENFRDVAHFPFVHRGTMGPNVERVVPGYTVRQRGRELSWTVPVDLGGTAFDGNQAVAGQQRMTYQLTLPCFSRIKTEFPDGGLRFTIQLVAPQDCKGELARQFWLVAIDRTVSTEHGVTVAEMFDYERRIFEEDWPIVSSQEPKEAPLDLRTQLHTRADNFSLKYRRAYRDLVSDTSAGGDGRSRQRRVAAMAGPGPRNRVR